MGGFGDKNDPHFSSGMALGVHLLHVSGEIDIGVREVFRKALVVDLRQVAYIDSTGISGLIVAYKALKARGDYFGVVISDPQIRRTMGVLGLTDVLNVHETMEAAIEDARAGVDAP
jgi:anti-anti-sigma factor